jgi:hypothetical protein
MRILYRSLVPFAVWAGLVAYAHAAPATDSSTEPAPQAPQRVSVEPGTDVPGNAKTIQMLLELQATKPSLEGGERPAAKRADPSEPRPQQPATATQSNPFAKDSPVPAPKRELVRPEPIETGDEPSASVQWRAGFGGLGGGGDGAQRPSQSDYRSAAAGDSADDRVDVKSVVSPGFRRFMRENRELVLLGSLMVLVAVWLGASLASRRPR